MIEDDVRARVDAFIADFHTRWEHSGRPPETAGFDPAVFERWRQEVTELEASHGTSRLRTGAEGAMSNPAPH